MSYLFDTNIFVESKKNTPMDVWPSLWSTLANMINSGIVFSIDLVKDEIERGGDELTDWIKVNAQKSFFLTPDSDVIGKLSETISWAMHSPIGYTQSAINDYVEVADSSLVATAAAKDMVLVTFEKSNPQRRNRIMIPDACNAIGVRCCNLNSALRELGITI